MSTVTDTLENGDPWEAYFQRLFDSMSEEEYLATPVLAPLLNIPSSISTVIVRIIDSSTTLRINPQIFWHPKIEGFGPVQAPVFCFLISNGDQHVLFDLGVRRDWENYAPSTVKLVKATTTVETQQNISAILDSDSSDLKIRSTDISAIIWSHHHFDHIGDPSTFPPSVPLIVGPGVQTVLQSAYPTDASSPLLDSDTADRPVHELNFHTNLHVGRFRAIDYFHDGSFYLLDAPGHAPGHICALARVTSTPDSFVFMAADACHHPGLLRPSKYLPLPRLIEPYYSGTVLRALHPRQSATEPFLTPGEPAFPSQLEARETLQKIMEFDAQDNVFVVMTHDKALSGGEIDLFPATINAWMAMGVKERTRWLFCRDFEGAMS